MATSAASTHSAAETFGVLIVGAGLSGIDAA
jgi:cation diffusion facilitator CzcD-associated flavoprotein CzcO